MDRDFTRELLSLYHERFKKDIEDRVEEFKRLWREASDERLYMEAVFCLLTPQSRATSCWMAVEELVERGLLFSDNAEKIAEVLKGRVRFHNTKARNLVLLKQAFSDDGKLNVRQLISRFGDSKAARDFLVEKIRGYGMKEASHFLRNIGYGLELAIIDRHIVKNLHAAGIIDKVPKTITKRTYLELENAFHDFARFLGIPPAHLDLLLWARQTGFVFK